MKLTKILLISRHNMRTPTTGEQANTQEVPTYPWKKWQVAPGNLTLQGITLETGLGHYFRNYLEEKNLLLQTNQYPLESLRFYANSTQRTIATANAFATGCFPMANVQIEYHNPHLQGDPNFSPTLTKVNPEFKQQVQREIEAKHGAYAQILPQLEEYFYTLFKVLNMLHTDFYKNLLNTLQRDKFHITLEENSCPELNPILSMANGLSYALLEQYYSQVEPLISKADMLKIYTLKDFHDSVIFATPSLGKSLAQPLLNVIYQELTNSSRLFSFIAGHDTNLNNLTTALNIEPYTLPNSIEKRTPLGGKIVIEKYLQETSQQNYAKIYYLYLSQQQLSSLDYFHQNPEPITVNLNLQGLNKVDGYYHWEDFLNYLKNQLSS